MNRRLTFRNCMDPVTHLVLPLLILLAARLPPRLAVPLSFFAIFPDFDSLLGPHRAFLHNVFVTVLIPLAFVLWSRRYRPPLVLPGAIVLFYMVSHVALDYSGVALLYPLFDGAFYFEPTLYLYTAPNTGFEFVIEYGIRELTQHPDYVFISEMGFAFVLIMLVVLAIFRRETKGWLGRRIADVKWLLSKIRSLFSRADG